MTESDQLIEAFDARVERRTARRDMFKMVLGATAVGAGAFAFASAASAQTITDFDVLNFALNLEYLEGNFYSQAVFGTYLANTDGVGTRGAVVGGRKVNFTDPVVSQYAKEIAQDEIAHVDFLRAAIGQAARVAQPAINIDGGPTGAFTVAARAANVVKPSGPNGAFTDADVFDPYASDEAFLLGAFIFEDVGVTAYKGAAALLTNKTYTEAAAGILAVEAYHASIVRTTLYRKGMGTPAMGGNAAIPAQPMLITNAQLISDLRDSLDGTDDLDQGLTTPGDTASNIVPLDKNGLAFSRTTGQVLNIVYANKAAVTAGGFFPNGVNGNIKASTAQA